MIKTIKELKVGDKVHYQPDHYKDTGEFENGIVKQIREEMPTGVWVVYNCGGNWDNYRDYTSALTSLRDLNHGWGEKECDICLKLESDCKCTEPDWTKKCINCDATPILPITGMCGPCTFGEADTAGGNW